MPTAGKLEILIDIRSKLDEIQAATGAMVTLREQTLAGVQGMQQAAKGMQEALQTGTVEASKLQEGFKAAADQGAEIATKLDGLDEATGKMAKLTEEAQGFTEQIKLGAGIEIGGMVVEGVQAMLSSFTSFVERGVAFNATVQDSQLGIAAILRQFDPTKFSTFDQAMEASANAIELLKQKALQSPATFEQLVSALQAVSGAASAANIPIEKQVDLVVLMSQALAGLGIRSEQIIQESRALLTGNITEDAMAARILGITADQVNAAKAQGQLFEFLTGKLSAFAEAGARGATSYTTAVANLDDALTQMAGKVAEPVFDAMRTGVLELNKELAKPEVAEAMRTTAIAAADLVSVGLRLTAIIPGNAQALMVLAGAAGVAATAMTAGKLAGWLTGLAQTTVVTRTLTAANEAQAGSAAMATAWNLQLSAARAGIAASTARDAVVQAEAELAVKGAVDAEAASYLRLKVAAATARADALAMTAASQEAAAMRATNIASIGGYLSAAILPVTLIAAGLWAASAAADAAKGKIKEMAEAAERTSRANASALSGADTYQKLLDVQAQMQEQIKQAQAQADAVHASNESFLGTVRSLLEFITLQGDLEQDADNAAQRHLLALKQQLADSGALAGIDTFRVKQAYELAAKQLDEVRTAKQYQDALNAQAKAEQANAQAIAAIQQEISTGKRNGVQLTQEQLQHDQQTLTSLREILTSHVGDEKAVRLINDALAEMVKLANAAANASAKLAETLAGINFDKLDQAGQLANLAQQHAGQQKAFQDLIEKRERDAFGPSMPVGSVVDASRNFDAMNKVIQSMPAGALRDQMTEVAIAAHKLEEEQRKITGEVEKQADTARQYRNGTAEEVALLQLKTQQNEALARGDLQTADAIASQVRETEMLAAVNDELAKSAQAQGKSWADLSEEDKDNAWQVVRARYAEKDAVQSVADAKKDEQERERQRHESERNAKQAEREATRAQSEADRQAAAERKFEDEQREQRVALLRERVADIGNDPTRSADEKSGELRAAIAAENAALADNIAYWKERNRQLQGVNTREALQEMEQNDRKIGQARRQQSGANRQVGVNDMGGQFKQSYVHQVDQLGTAAQNAGRAFDTTLNAAIDGTSQALEGLIFKTGSWKEAMAGAARAGINGLIQLGVKTVAHYALLGVQMLAHKVLGTTLKSQDTAETVANSATQAAALTPTALLQSITTYGVAAAIGVAAMLAAMALVGGFESGGYTGGVAGQAAGIVHGEEYVLNARATRALPRDFLDALNAQQISVAGRAARGAVSSGKVSAFASSAAQDRQDAGNVSVSGPKVKVVNVTDEAAARRELLNSGEFDHAFVHHMNRHGVAGRRT